MDAAAPRPSGCTNVVVALAVAGVALPMMLCTGLFLLGATLPREPEEVALPVSVHADSCEWEGSYYRLHGHAKNWSARPVHFVEIEVRFRDRYGQVVDVESTYAVGSERLRTGESAEFTASTEHAGAYGCAAELLDFRYAD